MVIVNGIPFAIGDDFSLVYIYWFHTIMYDCVDIAQCMFSDMCVCMCVCVCMRSYVYASNADFTNYDIISFSYLN